MGVLLSCSDLPFTVFGTIDLAFAAEREVARRCGCFLVLPVFFGSCFRCLDAALIGLVFVERDLFDRRFIWSDLNVGKVLMKTICNTNGQIKKRFFCRCVLAETT